jgi:hypothetical protein
LEASAPIELFTVMSRFPQKMKSVYCLIKDEVADYPHVTSWCSKNGKPWFLLVPNYVYMKDYYDDCLK